MPISLVLTSARQVGPFIWTGHASGEEIQTVLGRCPSRAGLTVVLVTHDPCYQDAESTLTLDCSVARTLTLGTTSEVLVIRDQGIQAAEPHGKSGDALFLAALTPELDALGRSLIRSVREQFKGHLRLYPRSNKFVESPDNFWTARIQPRDRSIRITLRGEPSAFPRSQLLLKKDMNGYSATKITSMRQIPQLLELLRNTRRSGK